VQQKLHEKGAQTMSDQNNNQLEEKNLQGRGMKRMSLALFILLALCGVSFFYSTQLQATEAEQASASPAMPPMPVETTEVKVAISSQELLAVGSLRSNESVVVATEITGRIEKVGFREGETGPLGQLLFQLDSSVLQAELDRAEASRALSEENYKRAEALLNEHSISELERDEAYAQWQLDEASSRLARAQLNKTIIKAPFAGTLGLRQVSVGDYVQPGMALVNLEDTSQLKVDFRVPEKFAAQVQNGQQFQLTTDAYPGQPFPGVIYAINPLVEEASRSLVVRGRLDNRDGRLRPGQFAKITLTLGTKSDALFIPEQALVPQPTTQLVFKVVDGAAQMVPVQTGQRRKGWVEITSGLAVGDVVVTGGHQKIGPGSPVKPLPADPDLFSQLDDVQQTAVDNG
jgi:membrane fusion protein (multidrug efflux system)